MSEAASAVPANHNAVPEAPPQTATAPELANRISELRVSGNLMTLDAGLFCVFQAPGSPVPDPATGLPGVRVSLAPGMMNRPESVSISTFRADGWLDGTGALVRVKEGPAQILVTIYQSGRQSGDTAPRLQVLRLNGEQAAPAPQPAAAPRAPIEEPDVLAHVQGTGDVGGKIGDWIGVRGSRVPGRARAWLALPLGAGRQVLRQPRDGVAASGIQAAPEGKRGENLHMQLLRDIHRRQRRGPDRGWGSVRGRESGRDGSAPNRSAAARRSPVRGSDRQAEDCRQIGPSITRREIPLCTPELPWAVPAYRQALGGGWPARDCFYNGK